MARVKMRALKAMRYATRRLRAGDDFTASLRDARVLRAVRLASDAPVTEVRPVVPQPARTEPTEPVVPPPQAQPAAPSRDVPVSDLLGGMVDRSPEGGGAAEGGSEDGGASEGESSDDAAQTEEIGVLRDRYEQRFGRRPDMRWGVARLQDALAEA